MQRPRLATLAACAATLASAVALPGATALAADPTIIVAPGDTLTSIARRTDTTVAQLVDLNDLLDPNRIFAGQRLVVQRAPHSTKGAAAAPTASTNGSYVVAPGDNLTFIAHRFGVSVASIVAANGIADPSRIFAGQRLTIPGATPAKRASPPPSAPSAAAAPAQPATRDYVVAPGDNLTFIARRFGVSVASIVAANGISDPGRIFAGQRLTIPGGAAAAAKPPSAATSPPPMSRDMAARVAARDSVRRLIVEEAARYDVPAPLALAVAWQESGWQPRVVSHAGAIGIMQLLPTTAEWVGTRMLGTEVDLYDARLNVRAGVRLLRHYLDRYDGDLDVVLAAYYQGQTAADRHGVYAVTRPYIASIRLLVRQFGG